MLAGSILLARRRQDAWVLLLTLVLYPFLYAAFPTSWFWNDGRYAISLTPILSLVIAGGLWDVLRPSVAAWAVSTLLVLASLSTLMAFNNSYGAIARPSELSRFTANPNPAVAQLAAQLERMGISHAYAGYWVANDLTFISDDRVTALSLGEDRNPPGASNAGRRNVAWIFVPDTSIRADSAQLGSTTDIEPGSETEPALIGWLAAHGDSYRKKSTDGFDVIIPTRSVSPVEGNGLSPPARARRRGAV